ncbi:MAG: SDR family oxidoreductase [Calditrichaeota bacterium]|nr:SDR family oxidoreductase [Calditrichota bacterium]
MNLREAVILVTGSANRVGKATALMLAKKGGRLVIHYNSSAAKARETEKEVAAIGEPPLLVQGDLSREKSWIALRDRILERFGKIDVLVNNAAIFYKTPFLQSTEKEWDHFMDVNLKSTYFGCRIMGEVMVRQQRGKIINLADIAPERVWPSYIPYCVSKAGVVALTKGLAKALAPHVSVNAVAPGAVMLPKDFDAGQAENLRKKIPLQRFGSAEDIAKTIAFLIEGGDFINGEIIKVDGGQSIQ